jgi:hypothetical protein
MSNDLVGNSDANRTRRTIEQEVPSAGFAPLHRFHADMVAIVLLLEELRVTHITLGAMQTMAENGFFYGTFSTPMAFRNFPSLV